MVFALFARLDTFPEYGAAGFSYVDWQFGLGDESDDIIAIVRTAYRGAVSSSALCCSLSAPSIQVSSWAHTPHLRDAELVEPKPVVSTRNSY